MHTGYTPLGSPRGLQHQSLGEFPAVVLVKVTSLGFNLESMFKFEGWELQTGHGRKRKVVMVGRNLIY